MKIPIFYLLLLGVVLLATDTLETDFRNDLCLNGERNGLGSCVCNPGYSEFGGSCFLSSNPIIKPQSHVQPRANNFCPSGSSYAYGQCIPNMCVGTHCGSSCPPGYELRAGFCVIPNPQCPPGSHFQNGYCYYQPIPPTPDTILPMEKVEVVPPLRLDIPVPEFIDPLDPNDINEDAETDEEDVEFVPDRRPQNSSFPGKNVVHNVNTVNAPTNVSTHNVNNVYIHITRVKSNGAVKAVVISNNETTVYDEQPQQKLPEDCDPTESTIEPITDQPEERDPCCTVVSPRICRKQEQDEWVCFHRKHYRCGSFCTSDVMYLKPQRPVLRNLALIMPPAMGYSPMLRFGACRWGVCPPIDCSGCLQGRYRCHQQCYTYDCAQKGGCNFINQDEYCDGKSDELCSTAE